MYITHCASFVRAGCSSRDQYSYRIKDILSRSVGYCSQTAYKIPVWTRSKTCSNLHRALVYFTVQCIVLFHSSLYFLDLEEKQGATISSFSRSWLHRWYVCSMTLCFPCTIFAAPQRVQKAPLYLWEISACDMRCQRLGFCARQTECPLYFFTSSKTKS